MAKHQSFEFKFVQTAILYESNVFDSLRRQSVVVLCSTVYDTGRMSDVVERHRG